MQQSPTAVPELLDGYRLIRFLGRGGFGEVWLCRSEAMGDYRAMKWIPALNTGRQDKEHQALLHYRKAAAALRSHCLLPIEHVGRNEAGLYYVMPLADGLSDVEPAHPDWMPLSLAAKLQARRNAPEWFSSSEVIELMAPVLEGLRVLSAAGLVHRDVKPDNILFFDGKPCLGDISLLAGDASTITRHGTPGYSSPSWYQGGHPDMYGAAATLYSTLTGNAPDRIGRSAFLWPPQGHASMSTAEQAEWKRLHAVMRRAVEEKASERYLDFHSMMIALSDRPALDEPTRPKTSATRMAVAVLVSLAIISGAVIVLNRSRSVPGVTPSVPTTTTASSTPAPKPPELSPDQKADYKALAGMVMGFIDEKNYANALASVEELLVTYPQARSQPAYSYARAVALQGLGRIDEAKAELRKEVNFAPNIVAMKSRKDLWEQMGDLESAEADLTRILDRFGSATFPLFLRADVRAQRQDFAGVQSDREKAYKANKADSEQRQMVDIMWRPLETKYPGYGTFVRDHASAAPRKDQSADAKDQEVLALFDEITHDITRPRIPLSPSAMSARQALGKDLRDSFAKGEYQRCLGLLDRTTYSVPALANTPMLSLFQAFLLKRLGRSDEVDVELQKECHRPPNLRNPEAHARLLTVLE